MGHEVVEVYADNSISTADRQRANTVFAALGVQRVVIDV
jgi:hypothetical protein